MKVVRPITCKETLARFKGHLRGRNERDYLVFRFGINLGLSTQELLEIRVEEVRETKELQIKNHLIPICESLQKEIAAYLGDRTKGYLFPSRLGKPLTRHQTYTILRNAAQEVDYRQPIGVMTLRKTFAYWSYQGGTPLQTLREYLNHPSLRATRQYIQLEDEEVLSFVEIDI